MCGVCASVHVGVRGQHGGANSLVLRLRGYSGHQALPVSLPELLTHRSLRTTLISLTHFVFSQTTIF